MQGYRPIIGISGKLGAGKDTVAEMIIKLSNNTYSTVRFAQRLKAVVATLTDTSEEMNHSREGKGMVPFGFTQTLGQLQQIVGLSMRQAIDTDIWVNAALANVHDSAVITDVRFPNEYERIKALGGVVWRVNGDPAKLRENDQRDHRHPSECALDDHPFDVVIENNASIEVLETKVKHHLLKLWRVKK